MRQLFSLFLSLLIVSYAQAQEKAVTQFSLMEPGSTITDSDWILFDFKNVPLTSYEVINDENGVPVIKAESNASASGIIREVDIDPNEYPIIEWRWKADDLVDEADLTKRSGDDYAARIYITFDIELESLSLKNRMLYLTASKIYPEGRIPARALNYIWSNKAEKNSIHPNPWTELSMLKVVRNSEDELGVWMNERRNILEDYRKVFKTDPPRINSIAIMTDSDNTKGSATAFYGDIIFKKE
jgi:hypothetical protein